MAEKLTLFDLQAHKDEPSYQFVLQTLNDLWENYMYNARELNDADVDQIDLIDIGFFREWCDKEGFFTIEHLLPESDFTMQAIIKYCIQEVNA